MKNITKRRIVDGLTTLSLVVAATVIGFLFRNWGLRETNIIVMYILFVLLTARFTNGYFYGIAASGLSFLLFNWFFTEPYFSLKINDPTLVLTVMIMTITATITSALTSKVKQTATVAREKEAESNALYQMTNHLTDAETGEEIASIAVQTVSRIIECKAACIICDEDGVPLCGFIQQGEGEKQIHRRLENPVELQKRMEKARDSVDVDEEFYNYPIYGRTILLAILRIPVACGKGMNDRQIKLVHAVMESTSLALERLHSLREQAKSRQEMAQERYRGNLLRAISHDLRTPLAGIMGNSEMLMGMTPEEDGRYMLAKDIYEDADWLHGLVENILNLTKFQDGHLALRKEPEAVEEVIGAALIQLKKRAPHREIDVSIPDTLLLVPMDAKLITQVLVNLLDNAVQHTSEEQKICISVKEQPEEHNVAFSVADRGYGIPQQQLSKVFQMFYTTAKKESSSKKGVGLGLSICQSIVEAHGGQIKAQNRAGGGAEFIFTLPLGDE